MADIKEIIAPRETQFEYIERGNTTPTTFIIRTPTTKETSEADAYRSKIWFKYMKLDVPCEQEVLTMMKKRGRFDIDEHNKELDEINTDIANKLIIMGRSKTREELDKSYQEAHESRINMFKKMAEKSHFTRHCVENKSDHAYHLTLLGICCLREDGTPVFAKYKTDGELDIEATFEITDNWQDIDFINTALESFIPFMMGYDDTPRHHEDILYKALGEKFGIKEEVAEQKIDENASIMNQRLNAVIAGNDQEQEKQEEEKQEEAKVKSTPTESSVTPVSKSDTVVDSSPVQEPVSQNIKSNIDSSTGLPVVSSSSLLNDEPQMFEDFPSAKVNLPRVPKSRPRGISAQNDAEDTTTDFRGIKTGDEDIVGDGSARPAGFVVRSNQG